MTKTPQIPALAGMTPLGLRDKSKSLAQRKADARLMPSKEQKPCDIGLFSDNAQQLDLVEATHQVGPRKAAGIES